ncbi:MAG: phenylalanine--tRNA ligase subunit alpha, partial [Anaplasma sp.]|nr:phenylalanine--tRNA ligase subunit alpha [Anaplasma sp.]
MCSKFMALLHQREAEFEHELLYARLRKDSIDITLPSRSRIYGRLHPITKVIKDIEDIFTALGFATVRGPD